MSGGSVSSRAAWGLADQVFSSLTNFALAAVVARNTSPREFGSFAVIFSTYILILGVSRAATTLPLLVRFSAVGDDEWRDAARAASGTAVVIGVAAAALCAAAAAILPGTRGALLALAVCLPGLMLQEAWRHAFVAKGTPVNAFINDLLWTVVLVPALVFAARGGDGDAAMFVLVWGIAGSVAAAVGAWQARAIPATARARGWLTHHRDLSWRQVGEFLANAGSTQAVVYASGAVSGLSSTAALRGGQVLLGPLHVAYQGVWIVGLAELVRVLERRPHLFTRVAVASSLALGVGGVVYVGLFLAFGDSLGPLVLGQTWPGAREVLVPMSLVAISWGLWLGATVGLRALQEASRSLRVRVIVSVMNVVGGIGGLLVGDAVGAAWGLGITYVIGVGLWWRAFAKAPRPGRGWVAPEPSFTPAPEGVA